MPNARERITVIFFCFFWGNRSEIWSPNAELIELCRMDAAVNNGQGKLMVTHTERERETSEFVLIVPIPSAAAWVEFEEIVNLKLDSHAFINFHS